MFSTMWLCAACWKCTNGCMTFNESMSFFLSLFILISDEFFIYQYPFFLFHNRFSQVVGNFHSNIWKFWCRRKVSDWRQFHIHVSCLCCTFFIKYWCLGFLYCFLGGKCWCRRESLLRKQSNSLKARCDHFLEKTCETFYYKTWKCV